MNPAFEYTKDRPPSISKSQISINNSRTRSQNAFVPNATNEGKQFKIRTKPSKLPKSSSTNFGIKLTDSTADKENKDETSANDIQKSTLNLLRNNQVTSCLPDICKSGAKPKGNPHSKSVVQGT